MKLTPLLAAGCLCACLPRIAAAEVYCQEHSDAYRSATTSWAQFPSLDLARSMVGQALRAQVYREQRGTVEIGPSGQRNSLGHVMFTCFDADARLIAAEKLFITADPRCPTPSFLGITNCHRLVVNTRDLTGYIWSDPD